MILSEQETQGDKMQFKPAFGPEIGTFVLSRENPTAHEAIKYGVHPDIALLLPENLAAFLKQHRAFKAFCEIMAYRFNFERTRQSYLDDVAKLRTRFTINTAFTWSQTKQGGDYWGHLHDMALREGIYD